ncbi:hypothetical protein GCM10020221_00690 [Streptomyces thioluteus]|uniref:Glycosyltransferase 2-like domain-containing protein n=1 Tax=Streptomyces thioluteus TaxID=66431 RepID=A0ABP6IT06_STRTU
MDGNSTDDTVKVARELWPSVKVVGQRGKGKGDALITGFAACTGEIIVMVDADGSADGNEIVSYVSALVGGADFAKGSRFANGGGTDDMTPVRKLGNRVLCSLVNQKFGARYTDLCYGYNAFWKRVLDDIALDCAGFEVETLMNIRVVKAGLKVQEIPSHEFVRIHGTSNLRAVRDGLRVLKVILHERGSRRRKRPGRPAWRSHRPRAAGKSLEHRSGTDHRAGRLGGHLRLHRGPLGRHPRRGGLGGRAVPPGAGNPGRGGPQPGAAAPARQALRG